ncbi:unnamed protein product [Notodromas monacha]|uniref:Isochorismatase-like domain-containing protein n=1 Tax=Notodromas monacha TaxID=399045 RepID=A0A7R9C1E5_9CRUS|nr:unnamed protein product [Notodromas monacha]CAG0924031.1 unnamed protein product [Notodromas monacha]
MSSTAKIGRLVAKNAALFLCDMQEKFRGRIAYYPEILQVSKRLLDSAKLLDIPIVATEQYPKGLGHTVPELNLSASGIKPFEKSSFSMCIPAVLEKLKSSGASAVMVCGIEAHVCVQHTTLALIEHGFDVHIIADACSSRTMIDRMYAFKRMKQSGAFITTSESAILGLVEGSAHPKFREVQKIIWESAPDTGLLKK